MGPGDCHDQCAHWSRNDRKLGAKRQTPIKVIGLKQQTRKLLFTQKGCHPERAQRVEGSTHFVSLSGKFSAKILRLRCASLRMTGFIGVCRSVLGTLQKHCRGGIDASRRRNVPFFRTVRRKRTMCAGGMNASPTVRTMCV